MSTTRADIEEMINILTHPENYTADEIEANKMNIVDTLRDYRRVSDENDQRGNTLYQCFLDAQTALEYFGSGLIGNARTNVSTLIDRMDDEHFIDLAVSDSEEQNEDANE